LFLTKRPLFTSLINNIMKLLSRQEYNLILRSLDYYDVMMN